MDQQLQQLLDKRACEEVILRYGRTLDWLDEAGQRSCFWPDAKISYGFFEGAGEDWVPTVMAVETTAARRWHMSSGVMVQVNGDRARSECYGLTVATTANEEGELMDTVFGGRYLDELEKREGEWRISSRTYVADWLQQVPHGLAGLASSGLALNVLDITAAGHEAYRPL